MSVTVTLKLQLDVPHEFVAVAVTVVVPIGNMLGDVIVVVPILYEIVGVGEPVAVALNNTLALHCPNDGFEEIVPGHVMTGALFKTNVPVPVA